MSKRKYKGVEMRIKIEEKIYKIDKLIDKLWEHGYLPLIAIGDMEYYLAAGKDKEHY